MESLKREVNMNQGCSSEVHGTDYKRELDSRQKGNRRDHKV